MAVFVAKPTPCHACPLKALATFRDVAPEELDFIQHFKSGELMVDPGATLLTEGSNTPNLYTVLSGWGFRYKTLPDGRRQILNFVLPGDFLGLQGSMLDEMQHSVEALTPMVLCVFPRDKLWTLYTNFPSLAFDLTWLAARSERILDETLLSLGRRSALERVAHLLLDVHRRAQQSGLVVNRKVRFPFTQQHLADALGLSLVHTNKTLKQLTGRGLIRWKSSVFEIVDDNALQALAKYDAPSTGSRPLI